MARRYGEKPLSVHRVGLAGSNSVRFEANIRHGKGRRQINVEIHAREILAIADAIRATARQACVGPRSRTAYPGDELSVGHAIWHLDNPEMPMPCIAGTIIDVPSDETLRLASGPQGSVDLSTPDTVDESTDREEGLGSASVLELVLSTAAAGCLADAEIRTLDELTAMTAAEVRALPRSSALVVQVVRRALAQVGLGLAGDQGPR